MGRAHLLTIRASNASETNMTNVAIGGGDEPAADDFDSIITQALADSARMGERIDDARADGAGDQTFSAAKASDIGSSWLESAAAAPTPSVKATEGTPAPSAMPDPAVTPQPIEPPARWTADDKAKFAQWPRDVQEAVLERNKALEADYTRKTQEAAELRRHAEPILNAVKPYEAYLSQVAPRIGQTPDQMIGNLIGVEYQLRTGDPHQKAQALQQIAVEYGIDLASISRGELPVAPDPHYQQLRQSFGHLEQRVAQYEQLIEQEQQRQITDQVKAFAKATDAAGRPQHPHFERVRGVMAQVLRDDPALNLAAAYHKAVEPIQQAIAEELRQREILAAQQRQEALDKARKAAPVKSTGSQPNGSSKSKGLDDVLWDSINARMA
jgi:hypothetical protein